MNLTEKELERNTYFRGKIFHIDCCKSELPNGDIVDREVMCHSGGVCVLPLDNDDMVTMVRQYRFGAGEITLEIPAGKLEPGENIFDAVCRELEEETGYRASHIESMGFCYSSPAISTEKIYLFLATELKKGSAHTDPDEFLEIERYPLDKLVQMVLSGEITDAKTQIAILKASSLRTRSERQTD